MIKVVIVDDHLMVVEGLKNTLSNHPSITITAAYNRGAELIRHLYHQEPDVVLLDLQLPDKNGTELVPLLLKSRPNLKILIFSSLETMGHIKDMMQKGCKGYLFKTTTDRPTLIDAITRVYEGDTYLDPYLKEQLFQDMLLSGKIKERKNPKLTHREKEILTLIATEHSSQQIADQLCIGLRTVETHRYNLLQKLEAKNTAGLCKHARSLGLID